ncbi:hypothetical protein ACFL6H_07395 [Candidatus Latescibacterota bacterium]
MKKKFLLVIIIVVSVFAGCIFSEDKKNEDPSDITKNETSNETAEKYYPLKIGSRWTYEATVSKPEVNDTTYTDIYEITESVIHNELSYYVERREIGGVGEIIIYFRTAENILYGVDITNEREELSYLNFDLSIGDSWYPTATVFEETFDGIVEMKVPAGTFSNCIKFRAEGYVLYNDIILKNEIKEYYAPNVGRVKSILIKTDMNGNIVSSEITNLISYAIPE